MAKFNPITDLMPIDSSNESVDESSEQIKVIRTQLIQTRNSLSNVVNIIKTKNSLLDRDLDKIKSLNDRLQRTIPRIPIMRGEAGVLFGDTIEEEKKKGSLKIPMFLPRVPMEEEVVTYSRPIVKQAADIVGNIFNIGLIFGFTKSLLSKPKVTIPTPKPSPDSVNVGDDLAKTIQDIIKKRKEQGLDVAPLEKILKSIDKIPRIPSFAKVKENISKTFKINKFRRKINPKDNRFFARRRKPKGKPKGADAELDAFIQKMYDEGQLEKFVDLYRKSPTAKNLALRDDFEGVFRVVRKVLQTGQFTGDPKSVRATLDAFTDAVYGMIDQGLIPNVKMKNFLDLLDYLDDVVARNIRGGDTFKTLSKKRFRRFESLFENIRREMINPFKDTSNINTKPMSNDIAMLNTDTGITNTVIIITDPPTA